MKNKIMNYFPIDIKKSEDGITVTAELPGFGKDEIEIFIVGDKLKITATSSDDGSSDKYVLNELPKGELSRTIRIGSNIDSDGIEADLNGEGILNLLLPFKKRKKVKVKIGG